MSLSWEGAPLELRLEKDRYYPDEPDLEITFYGNPRMTFTLNTIDALLFRRALNTILEGIGE